MRRALTMLALVALLAACGGKQPTEPRKQITGPPVDERVAEKDAKGTVDEIYGAISRGKPDNLFSVLDDGLIVFGPRKRDALATRTDALVALAALVDSNAKSHAEVRSSSLSVVASPGGHSAWAFDVVNVGGTQLAMTAILSNEDEFFRVTTVALAQTPSMREIRAELGKVAVVPPGAAGPATIAPSAKGAVERFQKGLLDQQLWGDDLASRSDAIVIGPASGEVTRGKKDIKKLWKKRIDAEVRAAISGEITAQTTVDGQLAWVTAPVTRVEKDEEPLPLRVFAVFEKHGADWKLVALHEALAVDEPGAGASFVKILPPALVPPEPPPVVEAPPKEAKPATAKKATKAKKAKKAKKTKKKKKKKKKRSSDDDDD